MKLAYAILYEPESISSLFLLTNLVGIGLFSLILSAWPLSFVSTVIYVILVHAITRWLAVGHQYTPTKNLAGQTVIVTNAATGIGLAAALEFAKLGARVIVGVRGQERAERVAHDLSRESNNGRVIGHDLDLSCLANVKAFADKIDQVDILVNNAGTLVNSYAVTADGIETQFGTNHIGHFYLTKLLIRLLMRGRVVNLILTIWHASELTRRYGINAYSLHLGGVSDTHIHQRNQLFDRFLFQCGMVISKTVQQGCMTTLFCALSDDARPGQYHADCCVREPSQLALDQHRAEERWEESEKLIDEKVQVKSIFDS